MPARAVRALGQPGAHIAACYAAKAGSRDRRRCVALQQPLVRLRRMQGNVFVAQVHGQRGGEGGRFRCGDRQCRRMAEHQRVAARLQMHRCCAQPVAIGCVEIVAARKQGGDGAIRLPGDVKQIAQQSVGVDIALDGKRGAVEHALYGRCIDRTPQRFADFTRRYQVRYVESAVHGGGRLARECSTRPYIN